MKLKKIQKDFVEALSANKPKTSAYDTEAQVIRVEGETAWVHIPGGVDETPVSMTINSRAGDKVRVRVSGGTAWLIGNDSAPPTDDMTAIIATEKAEEAEKKATTAQEGAEAAWTYAGIAAEAAHEAQNSAESANNSANNALTQLSIVEDVAGTLAWIQEHGSYVATTDTVVHENTIYFVLQDGDYVPIANPDPEANPYTEGWYVLDITDSQSQYIMAHLAVTSAGLWVLPVSQWADVPVTDEDDNNLVDEDNNTISAWAVDPQNAEGYKVLLSGSGMIIYNGSGAAVANYGSTITIGEATGNNVYIDSDSVDVRDGSQVLATFGTETIIYTKNGTVLAHFGYATGEDEHGQPSIAPYYDIGLRETTLSNTIGNYSVVEGAHNIAEAYASHAEGFSNIIDARAKYGHCEGYMTEADGEAAHAEGKKTYAGANYTHAQNLGTIAGYEAMTAIGKYNTDSNYLFAVGNGTSSSNQSDAFTVDGSGNATVAGALTAGNIDAGRTSSTVDTSAGSCQDVNISFNKTFASAPIVVVGFDTTASQAAFGLCSVAVVNGTITTTGFTARVYNADSSVRKPRVSWIAIGV